jgi:hypothetical protein
MEVGVAERMGWKVGMLYCCRRRRVGCEMTVAKNIEFFRAKGCVSVLVMPLGRTEREAVTSPLDLPLPSQAIRDAELMKRNYLQSAEACGIEVLEALGSMQA